MILNGFSCLFPFNFALSFPVPENLLNFFLWFSVQNDIWDLKLESRRIDELNWRNKSNKKVNKI